MRVTFITESHSTYPGSVEGALLTDGEFEEEGVDLEGNIFMVYKESIETNIAVSVVDLFECVEIA